MGMLRSRSEGGLCSVGNKVGMLRSMSEGGLGSDLKPEAPQLVRTESLNMRSYAVIQALPNESKFMHVELSANDGILCISMLQEQERVLQTFTLVKLVIKKLLVCLESSRKDVFIVCIDVGGKVEGEIWCYTSRLLRNKWLVTLRKNGARLAHVSKSVDGMLDIDNYVHMTLQGGEANARGC